MGRGDADLTRSRETVENLTAGEELGFRIQDWGFGIQDSGAGTPGELRGQDESPTLRFGELSAAATSVFEDKQ
jgi:hypothetical protein